MPAYRDFEIRVVPATPGLFRVSAECGGASRYADRIEFPVLEDASLNGISDAVRDLDTESVRDARRRQQGPDVDRLGAVLFDAVFSGGVRELFLESVSGVRAQQEVLRICLQIDITDPALARLASLPWEFMQHRERNEPLVLSSATTLIRRLPTVSRFEPPPFVPPVRVLFVMADARGNLDLQAERAEIEAALKRTGTPIEVVFRERMTWIEFDEELHRNDYHVVHFMGHGAFESDTGLLEFQDQAVPGREVGVRLLKEPATRLAVLNACRTAEVPRVAGGDAFASVAASLALAGVPAVIAMQFPVTDRAAIAFATRLYEGIAMQRSVEQAVDDARAGMRAVSRQEWGTPVILLRGPGDLFSAPAAPAPTADAMQAELAGIREMIAREKGVPHPVLISILHKMGEADVPADQIQQRLEARAADYLRLRDALTAQSAARPDVEAVRTEALRLVDSGDIEGARRKLQDNRTRIAEARRESAREEAELLDDEALIDRLELRYRAAATKHRDAADVVAFDRDAQCEHMLSSADALYLLGDEFGDHDALHEAADSYRAVAGLLDRARDAEQWARALNNLGITLAGIGEVEEDTALLEEAIIQYRQALEYYTRERDPQAWAMTHNNLGGALARIGRQQDSAESLEEAVRVYREALREYTHERAPIEWGTTQSNLGLALASLGERESGTARLEQAVHVFQEALDPERRDQDPLGWARTQSHLGNALASLAEREEDGTARLEEAVHAFRAALEELTLERVPLEWARAQCNLGDALLHLGARDDGTARIEEAAHAYREALTGYSREREPADWVSARNNLAIALTSLGEHESRTDRLDEAVRCWHDVLEVYTADEAPLDRALTQYNLAGTLHVIAMRTAGTRAIDDGIQALTDAVPVMREADMETGPPEELLATLRRLRAERS